jgi:hypothetical protein
VKRVLITGSRTWDDITTIRIALSGRDDPGGVTLVSGACPRGADRLCEVVAEQLGWTVERHPADWDRWKKRAGFIRNNEMADLGADVCLAFHRDNSRGTWHMINAAAKRGIPITQYIYVAPRAGC